MTPQSILAIVIWLLAFVTAVIVYRTPGALAAGLVLGWLFLPNFTYSFSGLPDWDKAILVSMVSTGLMFAVPRAERPRLRFSWMDLPAAGIVLFSIPPSVSNGLGLYDGLSSAYSNFWLWTAPYLIGRRVFGSHATAKALIRITILGGLVYAAFCLYEIKMSPRLHSIVYGIAPRPGVNYFTQAVRYGMWRPTVFMEHGLAVAIFMSITSTLAWWAHVTGAVPRLAGLSMRTVAGILGLTTVLCVSSGAIALMAFGWVLVSMCNSKFGRVSLFLATLLPFVYPVTRMLGSGVLVNAVVSITKSTGEQERAGSFQFRVDNEELMLRTWKSSPIFGRARYFRHLDESENKTERAITDSFWIIELGKRGLCGWLCWTALLTLPAAIAALRSESYASGIPAIFLGLSLCTLIFALDGLLNAMPNPIFVVVGGAAVSLLQTGQWIEPSLDGLPRQSSRRSPWMARALWPPRI